MNRARLCKSGTVTGVLQHEKRVLEVAAQLLQVNLPDTATALMEG